ncbi:alpha/beta hydrolase [Comamonas serinivorans]|uniref:Alpha/beta hydrolase n=2 Tax=Comamonas serinivorans TaxID=1082851 RepID=A0A1Y0ETB6_9BURK|nr:alpha/beta hydrolase [Comamonas serinivorans]
MRQLVQHIERAKRPAFHTLPVAQARAAYDGVAGLLDVPPPDLARVQALRIPTRDGAEIGARLYAPRPQGEGDPLPVLMYFHGGGFTVGNLATHDVLCRVLSVQSSAAVVSVDYRLAPEYRFPTAVHDSWDALDWLVREAEGLGLDGRRLAVGGDSAGGTLAAVAAVHARDIGLPLALQVLFYPGTCAHQDTPSHTRFAHSPLLDEALITWFFQQYIDEVDREDWRFAPLVSADVDGVAPAWIGLAEVDPLVDEGVAYADKLRMAGVPVELEIYRGVTHAMMTMSRAIAEARQAQRDAAKALRDAFGLR